MQVFGLSFYFHTLDPLTIANLSLSYHSMVAGILSIALHLWKYDMSTGTEPLELAIVVLPAISHILMFAWAGYMFFSGYNVPLWISIQHNVIAKQH